MQLPISDLMVTSVLTDKNIRIQLPCRSPFEMVRSMLNNPVVFENLQTPSLEHTIPRGLHDVQVGEPWESETAISHPAFGPSKFELTGGVRASLSLSFSLSLSLSHTHTLTHSLIHSLTHSI